MVPSISTRNLGAIHVFDNHVSLDKQIKMFVGQHVVILSKYYY